MNIINFLYFEFAIIIRKFKDYYFIYQLYNHIFYYLLITFPH